MKIRISPKLLRTFPSRVYEEIVRVGDNHYIKSFNFEEVSPDKLFYVGEGESFDGVGPNGELAGFEVVNENNIGASGLSYKIGSQFKMPAGSYLIQTYYYGKYFMVVYKIVGGVEEIMNNAIEKIKAVNWDNIKGNPEEVKRYKTLLTQGDEIELTPPGKPVGEVYKGNKLVGYIM